MWFSRFRRRTHPVDHRVQRLYNRHAPLAGQFHFVFARRRWSPGGRPNVLLLGNHSSGKSTWINYLLQGEAIQDTGVAPTDDGFTLLIHGDTPTDHQGPAALRELPEEFAALDRLGNGFLQRLKVKRRDRPLLESVNLIDSPGMIDTAAPDIRRDYDFMVAVRRMAEIADLILFLFDPDKPGTTAESLQAIRLALPGMHFKTRFVLNKADTFENMHDFARAYGALCWNLARVLTTKDLPVVHTTYVPLGETFRAANRDLSDFDRRRDALIGDIRQAETRRMDNIISRVRQDLLRLWLHVRVARTVRRRLLAARFRHAVYSTIATLLAGLMGLLLAVYGNAGPVLQGLAALVLAAPTGWLAARIARDRYRGVRRRWVDAETLDALMRQNFLRERATEGRDDLDQAWTDVRTQTRTVLESLAERIPFGAGDRMRQLEADLARIDAALR